MWVGVGGGLADNSGVVEVSPYVNIIIIIIIIITKCRRYMLLLENIRAYFYECHTFMLMITVLLYSMHY